MLFRSLARAALGDQLGQGFDNRAWRGILQQDLAHAHVLECGDIFIRHYPAGDHDDVISRIFIEQFEYFRKHGEL